LLNLERDLPTGGREERLLSLIHRTLDPVLPETASIAGLRESLDAGTFAAAAITGPAQEALRASSP
jgi:hypothetical protein